MRNQNIEKENVLLVEGPDDVRLVNDLLKTVPNGDTLQCINSEGKDKMPAILKQIKYTPGFSCAKKVAVMIDADNNPAQAVKDALKYLRKAEFDSSINTSFQIVPQSGEGMLEDICMESVSDSPVMACIESFIECVNNSGLEIPRNKSKQKFLAYISTLPKATDGTVKAALQKSYFDLSHSAFNDIRNFLIELCS